MPTPRRCWATRFARSSSSRYVRRTSPATSARRSGTVSATISNRSARLNSKGREPRTCSREHSPATLPTGAGTVSLNHMGLCVSDLAASLAFYRDVAGFTVQSGPYKIAGERFDTLTWNDGAEIEVAMLELDGFTIQLAQYHAAGAAPAPTGHNHVRNPHLCINVVDVASKHDAVVAS